MGDGLLVVDKGRGVSSHDVVSMARRVYGTRSVGHAGTLDPMATGVLVLGIGQGTKLLRFLELDSKRYRATVRLGELTDSWDADGRVIATASVPELTPVQVAAVAKRFEGLHAQRAPAISAIKRGGEPLYKKVLRGEQVQAPIRDVVVHELRVHGYRAPEIDLEVHTGKGFYVRSLAKELAEALGTCGHLTKLRRLASGSFVEQGALPMDVLVAGRSGEAASIAAAKLALAPLAQSLGFLGRLELDPQGADDARQGRLILEARVLNRLDRPQEGPEVFWGVFDAAGQPLAVAKMVQGGFRVVRGFPGVSS